MQIRISQYHNGCTRHVNRRLTQLRFIRDISTSLQKGKVESLLHSPEKKNPRSEKGHKATYLYIVILHIRDLISYSYYLQWYYCDDLHYFHWLYCYPHLCWHILDVSTVVSSGLIQYLSVCLRWCTGIIYIVSTVAMLKMFRRFYAQALFRRCLYICDEVL